MHFEHYQQQDDSSWWQILHPAKNNQTVSPHSELSIAIQSDPADKSQFRTDDGDKHCPGNQD
jgi:hypothetical protein